MSRPLRSFGVVVGTAAAVHGFVGATIGFGVGVVAYAPTAPFAAVEIGAPATLLGIVLSAPVGLAVAVHLQRRLGPARGVDGPH